MKNKRSTFEVEINSADAVDNFLSSFMNAKGFKKKFNETEMLWQSGKGILTASKFFKFEYSFNKLYITAWIDNCYSEMPIDGGFVGSVIKAQMVQLIKEIQHEIKLRSI